MTTAPELSREQRDAVMRSEPAGDAYAAGEPLRAIAADLGCTVDELCNFLAEQPASHLELHRARSVRRRSLATDEVLYENRSPAVPVERRRDYLVRYTEGPDGARERHRRGSRRRARAHSRSRFRADGEGTTSTDLGRQAQSSLRGGQTPRNRTGLPTGARHHADRRVGRASVTHAAQLSAATPGRVRRRGGNYQARHPRQGGADHLLCGLHEDGGDDFFATGKHQSCRRRPVAGAGIRAASPLRSWLLGRCTARGRPAPAKFRVQIYRQRLFRCARRFHGGMHRFRASHEHCHLRPVGLLRSVHAE